MALCVRVFAAHVIIFITLNKGTENSTNTEYGLSSLFRASEDLGHSSNCHTKDCAKRETNFMRKPETEIHLFCQRESRMTAAQEKVQRVYKCKWRM